MKNPFLEAGRVVGTHGVRGELRVEPWCDSARFLTGVFFLSVERPSGNRTSITPFFPRVRICFAFAWRFRKFSAATANGRKT